MTSFKRLVELSPRGAELAEYDGSRADLISRVRAATMYTRDECADKALSAMRKQFRSHEEKPPQQLWKSVAASC
jgi:hypothetical protein